MCPLLTASSTLHSGFRALPQAASLGLPGRSKSWGRGCRRVGIYTSGSGMGSPRKTGTWAQKRKRYKSENLGEPKIEVLNSRVEENIFLVVREPTLTH